MRFTSQQISAAAKQLQQQRPAYDSLLRFYARIFTAQLESRKQINLEPIHISKEILQLKSKEKFPLINPNGFKLDLDAARQLFLRVCAIAQNANPDLTAAAQTVRVAVNAKNLDPENLFVGLLESKEAVFENSAKALNIDKAVLAFMSYCSIQPSLGHCAQQLSAYLDSEVVWGKGYCPVCGSLPVLSWIDAKGRCFLLCSFCWHKWAAPRMVCPFCETKNSAELSYFYTAQEPEYQVHLCDQCRKYIKSIDTRKTERTLFPPLEQVATIHLDMQARAKGYESLNFLT